MDSGDLGAVSIHRSGGDLRAGGDCLTCLVLVTVGTRNTCGLTGSHDASELDEVWAGAENASHEEETH